MEKEPATVLSDPAAPDHVFTFDQERVEYAHRSFNAHHDFIGIFVGKPRPAPGPISPWTKVAGLITFVTIIAAVVVVTTAGAASYRAGSAPLLRVGASQGQAADCAHGSYPSVTIANGGRHTLHWTASTPDSAALVLEPSSGALAAGASQTITVSGTYLDARLLVDLQSDGGNATYVLNCG